MTKQKRPTQRDDARREPKTNVEDVASLINERRKFEDWIAALEAKKTQTAAHVYTRVHADYEARLQAVVEKLASHTSSLGNELAGLKKKLEKIDDEIGSAQDERVELELRSHVGELDSAEVAEAMRAADDGLARLAASRQAVEADLVRVTEFFAAAGGGPAPSAVPPRRSRVSFDELSFLQSVVGENAETTKPSVPRPKPNFELEHEDGRPVAAAPIVERTGERAALKVADRPIEHPVQEPVDGVGAKEGPPEPATAPFASPAQSEASVRQAIEDQPVERVAETAIVKPAEKMDETPAETVAEKAAVTAVAKPVEEQPPEKSVTPAAGLGVEKETESLADKPPQREARLSIVMQQMSQTIEPEDLPRTSIGVVKADESMPSLLDGLLPTPSAGEKPFAANVASNNPLSLKSAGKGDVKTLKCRECGAMNDPTEWYCERCGAELTAV